MSEYNINNQICCSMDEFALLAQLVIKDAKLLNKLTLYTSKYLDSKNSSQSDKQNDDSTNTELDTAKHLYNQIFQHFNRIIIKAETQSTATKSSLTEDVIKDKVDFKLDFPIPQNNKKRIKIYVDGVFDLVHFGHFNAIRQAHNLGDDLYVGVVSDEEACKAKGVYPVFSYEERARIIKSCRWVTEIISNAPYDVTLDFFKTTGCDYVAHGDDMALNDQGVDCYEQVRQEGYLKTFKRTKGISTTFILSRLLGIIPRLPTFPHKKNSKSLESFTPSPYNVTPDHLHKMYNTYDTEITPLMTEQTIPSQLVSKSLISATSFSQFVRKCRTIPENAKVVYVDGSFDILHCGHLDLLEEAKSQGDYLIVGVYDDSTTRAIEGPFSPLQPMLERALKLLAINIVDDVALGVTTELTDLLLTTFKISKVIRPKLLKKSTLSDREKELESRGILHYVPINASLTTDAIIDRILSNRTRLESSLVRRRQREALFT